MRHVIISATLLTLMAAAAIAIYLQHKPCVTVIPPDAIAIPLADDMGWQFQYPGPDMKYGTRDDSVSATTLYLPSGIYARVIFGESSGSSGLRCPAIDLKISEPGVAYLGVHELPRRYEFSCNGTCSPTCRHSSGFIEFQEYAVYKKTIRGLPAHSP